MGRSDRHEEIIRLVSKLREVSIQTFAQRFGVSGNTIYSYRKEVGAVG
jgi:DeoR/GlpR family transcriptional regulator of sugar metabolism